MKHKINLEDIRHVPQIEHIMKLYSSWQECCCDLCLQGQGSMHKICGKLLNWPKKIALSHVLGQDACVDGDEGIMAGEAHGKHTEVTLQKKKKKKKNEL